MRKAYLFAAILAAALITVSCTKTASKSDQQAELLSTAVTEEKQEPVLLTPQEEYIALVESYVEGASFQTMEDGKIKEVSDMLMGHYDVIGRTAGNGMDYYLAVRREDAPAYADYKENDIGHVTEGMNPTFLHIGYYDKDGNSKTLYQLEDYDILAYPLGYGSLDCFCLAKMSDLEQHPNSEFSHAFTKEGRQQIDFIKNHAGLSFYDADTPCIGFEYQDEDTIEFWSTTYPCYIKLSSGELEEISSLLSSAKVIKSVKTGSEAWDYMHAKDPSIRTTGAKLCIGDREYALVGNGESTGYIRETTDEWEFVALKHSEDVYRLVMDKIKEVMRVDYSSFDPQWFKTPLQSANIQFPQRVKQEEGDYATNWRTQIVTDPEKLKTLSGLMDRAINSEEIYGFSACPFTAPVEFVREDGQTLRIFLATDSCDSLTYEGRMEFQYGKQSEMAVIFDEAMADTWND